MVIRPSEESHMYQLDNFCPMWTCLWKSGHVSSSTPSVKWSPFKSKVRKYVHNQVSNIFLRILFSWIFGIQCIFGGVGCSWSPGVLAFLFITGYIMVVCGCALLLRYSEGATLLAIVMVSFSTPLKPASDQHVISPYRNTAESFIKITRTLCGMEYIFYMCTSHVSLTGIVHVHFSCELEKKNPWYCNNTIQNRHFCSCFFLYPLTLTKVWCHAPNMGC